MPSQLLRQYRTVEPPTTGKLCEMPLKPESRSDPLELVVGSGRGVVRQSCFGWPTFEGSFGQTASQPDPTGGAPPPHGSTVQLGFGTHCTMSAFFPLPAGVVLKLIRSFCFAD